MAFSGIDTTVISFVLTFACSGTENAGVIERVTARVKININARIFDWFTSSASQNENLTITTNDNLIDYTLTSIIIRILKALILEQYFVIMEISVDQMYQIENNGHAMGFLKKFMMENAGAVAVRRLIEEFGDVESKNILIFVGMGNNGGDGLVMARHLAGYDAHVFVCLLGSPEKIKTEESKWNWSILEKMPSVKLLEGDNLNFDFTPDVIVDGILGTGISGEIREPYASAMNYINNTDCFKLAVDVPSGLDPQTGETANIFVNANMTVTFHKMKQGIPKRKDLTGKLFAEKIGIPPEAEDGVL